jgi:hypothetical protein
MKKTANRWWEIQFPPATCVKKMEVVGHIDNELKIKSKRIFVKFDQLFKNLIEENDLDTMDIFNYLLVFSEEMAKNIRKEQTKHFKDIEEISEIDKLESIISLSALIKALDDYMR